MTLTVAEGVRAPALLQVPVRPVALMRCLISAGAGIAVSTLADYLVASVT